MIINFTEKRLDEMEFVEISNRYKIMFANIIGMDIFLKIENLYKEKYERLLNEVNKGKKFKGGTLGRAPIAYARNILYGWFLEELLLYTLLKNKNIDSINFFGSDSGHDFFVNKDGKIEIKGNKTTLPDYIIKLKNGKEFLLELKSASKGVFTIKKGNVDQLYKSCAYNEKITLIIMIDLLTGMYDIKGLNYFRGKKPFVNNRMEGQLCYDFPRPYKELNELIEEDFSNYLEEDIFENEMVKKLVLLKKAEEKKDKKLIQIIKNKLKIEKLLLELEYKEIAITNEINKIKERYPEVIKDWKEIEKMLNS